MPYSCQPFEQPPDQAAGPVRPNEASRMPHMIIGTVRTGSHFTSENQCSCIGKGRASQARLRGAPDRMPSVRTRGVSRRDPARVSVALAQPRQRGRDFRTSEPGAPWPRTAPSAGPADDRGRLGPLRLHRIPPVRSRPGANDDNRPFRLCVSSSNALDRGNSAAQPASPMLCVMPFHPAGLHLKPHLQTGVPTGSVLHRPQH
jgi:hypothetical protein